MPSRFDTAHSIELKAVARLRGKIRSFAARNRISTTQKKHILEVLRLENLDAARFDELQAIEHMLQVASLYAPPEKLEIIRNVDKNPVV